MIRRRARLRILISSGPTREPLDPVRYLSNYSTGVMGACLAGEALRRGHAVTVVSGPVCEPAPSGARVVSVERAEEMRRALRRRMSRSDVLIMAAAVCDFQASIVRRQKTARSGRLTLRLRATPDIVAGLPRRLGQLVVGFALETSADLARVRGKLLRKRLDLVVGQVAGDRDRPFGHRAVTAVLLDRGGGLIKLGRIGKPALARAILDKVEGLWYGGVLARQASVGVTRNSGAIARRGRRRVAEHTA
jgi:phosphopantothenoylcysteine decarboxylase/phosphopantothenate--cysteine ligase